MDHNEQLYIRAPSEKGYMSQPTTWLAIIHLPSRNTTYLVQQENDTWQLHDKSNKYFLQLAIYILQLFFVFSETRWAHINQDMDK